MMGIFRPVICLRVSSARSESEGGCQRGSWTFSLRNLSNVLRKLIVNMLILLRVVGRLEPARLPERGYGSSNELGLSDGTTDPWNDSPVFWSTSIESEADGGRLSANDAAAGLGHGRGSSESSGIKRRQIEVEKRTKVRWGLTNDQGHVI